MSGRLLRPRVFGRPVGHGDRVLARGGVDGLDGDGMTCSGIFGRQKRTAVITFRTVRESLAKNQYSSFFPVESVRRGYVNGRRNVHGRVCRHEAMSAGNAERCCTELGEPGEAKIRAR